MTEPREQQERPSSEALDRELEDLEITDAEEADKVTGGTDPCEGGEFHKR